MSSNIAVKRKNRSDIFSSRSAKKTKTSRTSGTPAAKSRVYYPIELPTCIEQQRRIIQNDDPKHMKSLCIFDYDDTLFPTSVLNFIRKQQKLECWTDINVCTKVQDFFELTDGMVFDVLSKALEVFNAVKIVSNGSFLWIKETCRRFLPETYSLLFTKDRIEVISARDKYQRYFSDQCEWKRFSFTNVFNKNYEAEIQRERKGEPAIFAKNFVSIGDGKPELKATERLKNIRPHLFTKAVVLSGKRNCTDFYRSLELLLDQLDEFEAAEENQTFYIHSSH